MFKVPEKYRLTRGDMATSAGEMFGVFRVPTRPGNPPLTVLATDGNPDEGDPHPEARGWEHVSVSLPHRCPTWEEMCKIKALFWDDEDAVMELHPPRSTWVNNHPYCLHLWRPVTQPIPLPPGSLVGVQSAGVLTCKEN